MHHSYNQTRPHVVVIPDFLPPIIGSTERIQLGAFPNPPCPRDLPLFPQETGGRSGLELPAATSTASHRGPLTVATVAVPRMTAKESGSHYDPTAALPPKLVTRILNLEFIEMAELVVDVWQDEAHLSPDRNVSQRHRVRHPPVTDIMTWLECFARMAAVLSTKYPDKAPELWAYQSSILRAAKNYEGLAWVAYDRQYRREALARKDLNWSVLDSRLYNEAFTGRAKAIPRCRHCLSEAHASTACPIDPNPCSLHAHTQVPAPMQAPPPGQPPVPTTLGSSRREICRNFNEGRCKFQHCKYTHVCKECLYPHPWILCHSNPAAPQYRQRPRSPRRPQRKGPLQ